MLHQQNKTAGDGASEVHFRVALEVKGNPCFEQHRVFGQPLLPTDAYLELLYVAGVSRLGFSSLRIEDLRLTSPLFARGRDFVELEVVLRGGPKQWRFVIRSECEGRIQIHAKGTLFEGQASALEPIATAGHNGLELSTEQTYGGNTSFSIGPFYRSIRRLWLGSDAASSELALSAIASASQANFMLCLPMINGGLMTALRFAIERSGDPNAVFVPTSIASIELREMPLLDGHGAVRLGEFAGTHATVDTVVTDGHGRPAITIQSMTVTRIYAADLGLDAQPEREVLQSSCAREASAEDCVAVIGFSGRFPGARDVQAFWSKLRAGVASTGAVPAQRWNADDFFDQNPRTPGRTTSKWGGFLDDIEQFDAEFFGISPVEALHMDPQQRLLLKEAYRALENAGQTAGTLAGLQCGVYVGAASSDYQELLAESGADVTAQAFTGLSPAVLAGRISYLLDLKGPAICVDTACSSSLTAFNLACQSILFGECDVALAGGVHLMLTPRLHIKASKAGMLSATGACKPFDAAADGIALGEGVGVVVLKRLRDALRDGDHVHAVVRGFATNQDGKTNGITAPNPQAQTALQLATYRRFGIDPREINYVEAHGTGTRLGDPIEFAALTESFRAYTTDKGFCRVGSVKSNIGHTAHCAGIASVIKVLLALRHEALPGNVLRTGVNPLLDLTDSPFRLNAELSAWDSPRCAAINSFGFSGTSCHLVLGEGLKPAAPAPDPRPQLVAISVRSRAALVPYLSQLRAWLAGSEDALADISYTQLCRRDHHRVRLTWVVRSREELCAAVEGALGAHDALGSEGVPPAGAQLVQEAEKLLVAAANARGNERHDALRRLGEAFCAGASLDFRVLFRGPRRLVDAPGHPFLEQRFWPTSAVECEVPASPAVSKVGPVQAQEPQSVRYLQTNWSGSVDRPAGVPATAQVLVFSDDDSMTTQVAEALVARATSARVIQVRSGTGLRRVCDEIYEVELGDLASHQALWDDLSQRGHAISHIVMVCPPGLPALSVGELQRQKLDGFYRALWLTGAARARAAHGTQILLCHTIHDGAVNPAYAALEGLAQSVQRETPGLHCRVVAWESCLRGADIIVQELERVGNVAARYGADGRRKTATLDALSIVPAAAHGLFRKDGAYLITGGAGGLGTQVAAYLASEYRARVLLVGRRPESPELHALCERLGADRVSYVQADVSTRTGVGTALRTAQARLGALHGVLHLAGEIRRFEQALELDSVESVLRPKIDGTFLLDEACAQLPLDFFLLFSSVSSVYGNAGQSDYAFANSYLDHFANYRESLRVQGQRRGRSLSVSLPLWRGGRLPSGAAVERLARSTSGSGVLDAADGCRVLEALAGCDAAHIVISVGESAAPQAAAPLAAAAATAHVASGACAELTRPQVLEWLMDEVGAVLKLERDALGEHEHLMEYGFDSILLTEFTNRLNDRFPLELTPAALFTHSSLGGLCDHLIKHYASLLKAPLSPQKEAPQDCAVGDSSPLVAVEPASAEPLSDPPRHTMDGIAIVGMAVELGGAESRHELWQHLLAGRVLTQPVPKSRAELAAERLPEAGFLGDVASFDAEFFGISPREAKLIDPQHRRFLEIVWRTIEDAGYAPAAFAGSQTGVFVGVATSDYESVLQQRGSAQEALAATGTSHALLPNRVSYYFDLRGPSEPSNTACSSSLVAVHRACEAIRSGACDAAIAGGVNFLLTERLFRAFGAAGMLSPSGKLRAFDRDADGYVRGEGVGAFLLKPLAKAIAEGDHVYGVIRGSGVNHGGRAGSLTAPNPRAQTALIAQVYRQAGIAPDRIGLIEAHGSGTPLGDPIELNALSEAFGELYAHWGLSAGTDSHCAVSTIKGNLGHLEAAAGVAGLCKVLLALSHGAIPGNASLVELNPQIRLKGTPLDLPTQTLDWPRRRGRDGSELRVAGVSSFGFGGVNAHLAVEEFRAAPRAVAAGQVVAFLLSARTGDALARYALRVVDEIDKGIVNPEHLLDLAFTSQVGREAFSERLAILVTSASELAGRLRAFAQSGRCDGPMWHGSVGLKAAASTARADEMRRMLTTRDLDGLCQMWVSGEQVAWLQLHDGARRRLSFATYPFAQTTYWCDGRSQESVAQENVTQKDSVPKLKLAPSAFDRAPVVEPPRTAAPPALPLSKAPSRPVMYDEGGLTALLTGLLASTLHVPESELRPDRAFVELGLDSILAIEFVKRINTALGTGIKAVVLFDHPTLTQLARTLAQIAPEALSPDASPQSASKSSPPAVPAPSDSTAPSASPVQDVGQPVFASADVAVIGMAAQMPGAADVEQFWNNLQAGRCSIREVPPTRWELSEGTKARWGGFLDGADEFDPLFFRISPEEARWMDPQQRLFLQTAWTALEDAGYSAERLRSARCGTFVGVMNTDYYELIASDPERSGQAHVMTGNAGAILASRLAYVLDLKGPAMQIDSACSSSLLAIHLACRALQAGEVDLMLAGGVTLYLSPSSFAKMADAGMLSPSGHCFTFDARADGFVPAEGVGVVVLKRLEQAQRDGDRILGVIRGSATNQDGRTNGITAPSAAAQSALERTLYDAVGLRADSIDYVEAHGTATKLGDPIEVQALTDAFRAHTSARQFCALGAVKTNIGHTAAAAGVAGLVKILLSMRHRQIPPSLNYAQPNELVDFASTPFRVVTQLEPWPAHPDRPRRAALSSFGFGGTNVHLVIDEPPCAVEAPARLGQPELIVLSARTPERLAAVATQLAAHLRCHGTEISLQDLAFTLQRGRTTMEERVATVATSIAEVLSVLDAIARGGDGRTDHVRFMRASLAGDVCNAAGCSEAAAVGDPLWRVAERWLRDQGVSWEREGAKGRTVRLPTYPFAREQLWLPLHTAAPLLPPTAAFELDAPTSLQEGALVYSTELSPHDPLIADHRVRSECVCPGALLVALVQRVLDASLGEAGSALCDFVFTSALVVRERTPLQVVIRKSDETTVLVRGRSAGAWQLVATARVEPPHDGRLLAERCDLEALQARCDREVTSDSLYGSAAELGLHYGPALRSLTNCAVGRDEVLATVDWSTPARRELGGMIALAAAVESAMQALAALSYRSAGFGRAEMPFRLGAIHVVRPLTPGARIHVVRSGQDHTTRNRVRVLDADGAVCLELLDVSLRPLPEPSALTLLLPSWVRAPYTTEHSFPQQRAIAVYDAACPRSKALTEALGAAHERRGASLSVIERTRVDGTVLRELLGSTLGQSVRLYLLAADRPFDAHRSVDNVASDRDCGLYVGLTLLGACRDAGLSEHTLDLRLVTWNAHAVLSNEEPQPGACALTGFMQAALKELRHSRLQCFDLDQSTALDVLAERIAASGDEHSRSVLALRGPQLYTRTLERLALPNGGTPAVSFRSGGCYVIVGGLGGIGFELAKYLAEHYAARLVLVGTTALDDSKSASLAALTRLGGQALYLRADITEPQAVVKLRQEALCRFQRIDGVVHSALLLADCLVANLSRATLDRVLAPKEVGCVALVDAFRTDALDFMLFFSSAQSFSCDAGQSNYAAASCFEDAYVARMRRHVGYPLLLLNWGYWGSVGAVASDRYRRELERRGIGSIEPAEGMATIEACLAHCKRVPHVVAVKGDLAALQSVEVLEQCWTEVLPIEAEQARPRHLCDPIPESADEHDASAVQTLEHEVDTLERLSQQQLWLALNGDALFAAEAELGVLKTRLALSQRHARLFEGLLSALDHAGFISRTGTRIRRGPQAPIVDSLTLERAIADLLKRAPDLAAHVRLLNACVRRYLELLRGAVDAHDVLFPGGSTDLVQSVYTNPIAEFYNRICGRRILHEVRQRAAESGASVVRILEVGAGTGSTSAAVLAAIQEYGTRIEYHFTDVSPLFVNVAAERFKGRYPFMRFRTLDISRDLEPQGVSAGGFDIVLGANVLHATADISHTLQRIKRILKAGGSLLVSESTRARTFITMTFGLMDGWWSYNDESERLPAAPLLGVSGWRRVLAQNGLQASVVSGLPEVADDDRSHAVIDAISDGVTRVYVAQTKTATPELTKPAPVTALVAGERTPERALEFVRDVFARVLRLSHAQLRSDLTFENYGVDSLMAIKLAKELECALGKLPSTLLFEHNTLERLANYVSQSHAAALSALTADHGAAALASTAAGSQASEGTIDATANTSDPRELDIAVVGVAGRYPGASTLDDFWQNLQDGRSCITEVPSGRWPSPAPADVYTCKGGFIDDIDRFDPMSFGMLPDDATALDPQARVFLEVASTTLESAGFCSKRIDQVQRLVGVFVGAMNSDYEFMAGQSDAQGDPTAAHVAHWSIANRVSYHFDLLGPSLSVNTACSSSLTAIHMAVASLRSGECQLALAGGVNLILDPIHYRRLCAFNMLSLDARCRAFGAGANGFVAAEGAGAVLLRPLRDALRDGDTIHAIIKGSAINAGGKTAGFTVPNPGAQAAVVRAALESAGLQSRDVSYIEAHGTGTDLGDPIEVAALAKAFGDPARANRCSIGSVKASIGHLESAAGIAGLTKVILQLRERTLCPSLHTEALNPRIEFEGTPFSVQRQLAPWRPEGDQPLRAGVSSFGAGGANAHVIVEEYPEPRSAHPVGAEAGGVFILAARRQADLQCFLTNMLSYMQRHRDTLRLRDVLHTLQFGREHGPYRIAVVVRSMPDLLRKLQALQEGGSVVGAYEGRVETQESTVLVPTRGELNAAASAWVRGAHVAWDRLQEAGSRFVPLPTYPFARIRCWYPSFDRSSRQAAPPQDSGTTSGSTETDAPPLVRFDDVATRLRRLAAKVLKAPPSEVDFDVDVSEYGFDSINVMFMLAGIRDEFGVQLQPRGLIAIRTLRALAMHLAQLPLKTRETASNGRVGKGAANSIGSGEPHQTTTPPAE